MITERSRSIAERYLARSSRFTQKRLAIPRSIRYSDGVLSWDPPQDATAITHYRIYAGSDTDGALAREIPAGQTQTADLPTATVVFLSAYNQATDVESPRVPIAAPGGFSASSVGTVGYANTVTRKVWEKLSDFPSVKDWGAKGDYTYFATASMTSGSSTVTTTGMAFKSSDVGKTILVRGAGVGGADIWGTITAVGGANSVTASFSAGTTVSNAKGYYATDDTAAFQAALAALKTGPGGMGLQVPAGGYLITASLTVHTGTHIVGAGSWLSRGEGNWNGTALIQGPNMNADIFRSGHDPNFAGDDNWNHSTILQDMMLYGDRRTNKRGSGVNLYRPGENFSLFRLSAFQFPRHGVRVYNYGAPQIVDEISVHSNGSWITCTVSGSTFNATGHGLLNGERVKMDSTGSVPAPLKLLHDYYVVNSAANSFQLAATSGGSPITLTNAGSGTITALIGCGLSFEAGLNTLNCIGTVSADNCAAAAVEVVTMYSNSLKIRGIKSERTDVGLTPSPGQKIVLSCFNLNGGAVFVDQINCYVSHNAGANRCIIQQCNDAANTYGRVSVLGACTINPIENIAYYDYGYQNYAENISIPTSVWINKPQIHTHDYYFADRQPRAHINIRNEYGRIQLAHTEENPNVMCINGVNFGADTQGGFISVNSYYAGFDVGWLKASTAASNNAMFIRTAPQMFEIRMGNAVQSSNPTDPGTSYFEITPTRTYIKNLLWSNTESEPLHVGNNLGVYRARWVHGGDFYRFLRIDRSKNSGVNWFECWQTDLETGVTDFFGGLKLGHLTGGLPLKLTAQQQVTSAKIAMATPDDIDVSGLTDGALIRRNGNALGSIAISGTGFVFVNAGVVSSTATKVHLDDSSDVTSFLNQGRVAVIGPFGTIADITDSSLAAQIRDEISGELLAYSTFKDGLATHYGSTLNLASTAQVVGLDAIISDFDSRLVALEAHSHSGFATEGHLHDDRYVQL